jgi:ribose transport system ATP-binding protein
VLRDGRVAASGRTTDFTLTRIASEMLGKEARAFERLADGSSGPTVLRVEGLSSHGVFHDISFELHRGEILGFSGLVGAKRTEVVRAIFGADRFTDGTIEFKGETIQIRNPIDALRYGIGLVPENRKTEGFVRYLSNQDNIALTCLRRFERIGFIDATKKSRNAESYVQRLKITPPRIDFPTDTMSGGNQQKVVVAKWLSTDADIIILDEPTKGIDVGAKEEMYALLEDLVALGKSLIVVSSELPEIIGLCDRVIVMKEGQKMAEFSHEELDEERILHYSMEGTDI